MPVPARPGQGRAAGDRLATIRAWPEPLRDRARRATGWRLRMNGDSRPHYVVCGTDPLTYWVVRALLGTELAHGRVRITLVVPERRRSDGPDGRDVDGVQVVRADRLDEATFRRAGLAGADGLALLHQDDVGNMHAALCAQEVEPQLRLVVRMFNTSLANGLRQLFPDSAVLSDASMAAPAFVAAALGEVAPTPLPARRSYPLRGPPRRRAPRRTWCCGLAVTHATRSWSGCCPPTSPPPTWCSPRRPASRPAPSWRPAGWSAPGVAGSRWRCCSGRSAASPPARSVSRCSPCSAVIALLGWLNARAVEVSWTEALYLTLVTTLTGQDPDVAKPAAAQIMQVVLNLAGLALIPLITAVVGGRHRQRPAGPARRPGPAGTHRARGGRRAGQHRHPGDGPTATTSVSRWWRSTRTAEARGAALAAPAGRAPDGRGRRPARRRSARPRWRPCQALVVVSTDDGVNLRAALNARGAQPGAAGGAAAVRR